MNAKTSCRSKRQGNKKMNKKKDSKNNIHSTPFINRIADILVSLSKGKNAVTEIADDCKLSLSTTHYLLNVLTGPRFAIYDPINHLYYLGPLINQLEESPFIANQFLIKAATDEIKKLSVITQETLELTILLGNQARKLISVPSKHSLRVHESIEDNYTTISLMPLASKEKVMLSQIDNTKLDSILKSFKILEDPLIDIKLVKKELKQIGEKGYAISRGVRIPNAMSISAPVKNYTSPLSLTIIGPENRLELQVSAFTTELLASTSRLSNNIKKYFE
jgi:DNA-binding IclR family transcriptional regulator